MSAKTGTTLSEFFRTSGAIQELNPELALLAVQGYRDELAPAAKADDAFYRQFVCPSCKSGMNREFVGGPHGVGVTWVADSITPQALLRCVHCRLLMNPRSGIIIERGGDIPIAPLDDDNIGVRR